MSLRCGEEQRSSTKVLPHRCLQVACLSILQQGLYHTCLLFACVYILQQKFCCTDVFKLHAFLLFSKGSTTHVFCLLVFIFFNKVMPNRCLQFLPAFLFFNRASVTKFFSVPPCIQRVPKKCIHILRKEKWPCASRKTTTVLPPFSLTVLPVAW